MFSSLSSLSFKAAAAVAVLAAGFSAPALADAPEVTPLVSTSWLQDNLDNDQLLIIDTRSKISKSGKEDYLKGHIPGAIWSEYPGYWRTERDGVEGVLPSIDKMEAVLSELGVSDEKSVVIVPHGKSSLEFGSAARIYWTFKYLGHKNVAILDGGQAAWVAEKRPFETGNVAPEGDLFIAEPNDALLVSTNQVAEELGGQAILLDGRPEKQFEGKAKHKAATRFGHIPGAISFDQDRFYDHKTNRLKPAAELAALVPQDISASNREVISYCNTGHWAATNWFVLSELTGRKNVTLYDASMVGWSRSKDLPISGPKDTVASN